MNTTITLLASARMLDPLFINLACAQLALGAAGVIGIGYAIGRRFRR